MQLITWHRAIDNRTEQIMVKSLTSSKSQGGVFGLLGMLLARLGVTGKYTTMTIEPGGIYVTCDNGVLQRISGSGYSMDDTYYIIACYKKFSTHVSIGVVDSFDKIEAGIKELSGDEYKGSVIVNKVSSRGVYVYMCLDSGKKIRVPFGTSGKSGGMLIYCNVSI